MVVPKLSTICLFSASISSISTSSSPIMLTYGPGYQNLEFVIRQKDGSPLKPDSMTQKWIRFLDSIGFPRIRLHDLRHTNATALIQAGVNPRVVQQRLGHADVNITINTYTHVLPEMDEEAAEKLDSIVLHRA
ncbi:MAG: tyrosine-type recombinase/integrase [Clostridia bacterium]|nr:tyrosine-type recombinase/integrase [Clostridia bacterium]